MLAVLYMNNALKKLWISNIRGTIIFLQVFSLKFKTKILLNSIFLFSELRLKKTVTINLHKNLLGLSKEILFSNEVIKKNINLNVIIA